MDISCSKWSKMKKGRALCFLQVWGNKVTSQFVRSCCPQKQHVSATPKMWVLVLFSLNSRCETLRFWGTVFMFLRIKKYKLFTGSFLLNINWKFKSEIVTYDILCHFCQIFLKTTFHLYFRLKLKKANGNCKSSFLYIREFSF